MSVDLPSSTEPQVTSRRSSVAAASGERRESLEVADTLAVLHRGLAHLVVRARLASLGDPRRGDLAHDLVDRRRTRAHAARAGHVADGAETHPVGERLLVRVALDELRRGVE